MIGRLLLAIGVQLVLYGFFTEGHGASMNMGWGGGIVAAGVIFHLIAWKGKAV